MSYNATYGIHRTSRQSLVEYINRANSTNLTVEELIFSTPEVVDGTWRESATDKNTVIRITAREDSDYRDSTLIVYNRLDLTHLNDLLDFKIKTYLPETTLDLLKPVFRRFGIFLDAEDFQDDPLERINTDTPDADPIYILRAKPTAIGWIGQCQIQVGEGNAVIGDYLTNEMLPGLNYPVDGDGNNGSALVYMYSLDFTSQKEILDSYPVGLIVDEFSDDLLEAIQTVDTGDGKALWNLDPEAVEWSLHGAEIVYAGINDVGLPTNTSFKYVLGVKLRDDVTTPPGVMYLHYNDPFDPNEV